MRRKQGVLLPLELSILAAGIDLRGSGSGQFHGYQAAGLLREREGARQLTAHGTLYKALDRMAVAGLLEREWEDPMAAAAENRPRRRLYRVTALGEQALAQAAVTSPSTAAANRPSAAEA
jgi:DNA-binding PadR family transcriptional regulator